MKLGGRIDISIVLLCIVKIPFLLLMILHNFYFVQVTRNVHQSEPSLQACCAIFKVVLENPLM